MSMERNITPSSVQDFKNASRALFDQGMLGIEVNELLKLTFEEWWMEYERNATEIINRTAEEGK